MVLVQRFNISFTSVNATAPANETWDTSGSVDLRSCISFLPSTSLLSPPSLLLPPSLLQPPSLRPPSPPFPPPSHHPSINALFKFLKTKNPKKIIFEPVALTKRVLLCQRYRHSFVVSGTHLMRRCCKSYCVCPVYVSLYRHTDVVVDRQAELPVSEILVRLRENWDRI